MKWQRIRPGFYQLTSWCRSGIIERGGSGWWWWSVHDSTYGTDLGAGREMTLKSARGAAQLACGINGESE